MEIVTCSNKLVWAEGKEKPFSADRPLQETGKQHCNLFLIVRTPKIVDGVKGRRQRLMRHYESVSGGLPTQLWPESWSQHYWLSNYCNACISLSAIVIIQNQNSFAISVCIFRANLLVTFIMKNRLTVIKYSRDLIRGCWLYYFLMRFGTLPHIPKITTQAELIITCVFVV